MLCRLRRMFGWRADSGTSASMHLSCTRINVDIPAPFGSGRSYMPAGIVSGLIDDARAPAALPGPPPDRREKR